MKPLKLTPDQAQAAHEGRKTQHREIIETPYCVTRMDFKDGNAIPIYIEDTWDGEEYDTIEFASEDENEWVKCPYSIGDKVRVDPSMPMSEYGLSTTLEITDIRVEKLNDISEDDAKSEGIENYGIITDENTGEINRDAIEAFVAMWESNHGHDAWDENPYVFVYEFRRVEG